MKSELEIDKVFNGPPSCGQGGYVSGVVAKAHGAGICETSLKLPTPLASTLLLTSEDGETNLYSGDKLLVSAIDGVLDIEIPPCPSYSQTEKASANYRGHNSKVVFDTCFVCGTARHDHKAMRIFAGPVENGDVDGLHAANWIPNQAHCDEAKGVKEEFLWSALDCPGYFAGCEDGQLALLARYTATTFGTLSAGERATVIGWPITSAGRKSIVGTAIFNENRELVASAEGLWIKVDDFPILK